MDIIFYKNLIKEYIKINLKVVLQYDKDFVFALLAMLFKNFASIFTLIFIFDKIDVIAGYTFFQILFLYGFSLTAYSLRSSLFINTISLPFYIQDGTLDRFLLRPISPIMQIIFDGFDDDGWADLLVGMAIIIISIIQLEAKLYLIVMIPFFVFLWCFSLCRHFNYFVM